MSDFKSAFRAARAAGKTKFSWNGGSYSTELAKEGGRKRQLPPVEVGKPGAGERQRQLPPVSVGKPKAEEPKWADPGQKERGRAREDNGPVMRSNSPIDNLPKGETFMSDPNYPGMRSNDPKDNLPKGETTMSEARYKRGGSVRQPFSPPMGGAIGTARVHAKPSRGENGIATIGVTRSSRSYPKGK